jgi:hypothetical protein
LIFLLSNWTALAAGRGASATELLEKTRAKYASLKSYSDRGTVLTEAKSEGVPIISEKHTFTTYFRAPKQFFFDFKADPTASGDRYVLWIDGAEVSSWWKATGVHEKYPQGQGATGFAVGALPTKGSIGLIASLIFPGLQDSIALQEPRILPSEAVNGHPCYKIFGLSAPAYANGVVTSTSPVTLWIDAETLLIRKIFSDTPRESATGSIDRTTTTFEPRANPEIKASQFQFAVPGSK